MNNADSSAATVRLAINPNAATVAVTELEMSAPASAVWAVLTDFAGWPSWMPEISSARLDGPLAPGSVIVWTPYEAHVESRIVLLENERRLIWNGTAGAVHIWELSPTANGTLLRNSESIESWQAVDAGQDSSAVLTQALNTWNTRLAEQALRRAA